MTKRQTLHFPLPPETIEHLQHMDRLQVTVSLSRQELQIIESLDEEASTIPQGIMILLSLCAGGLTYGLAQFWQMQLVPLVGDLSIASALLVFGSLIATVLFHINLIRKREQFLGGFDNKVFWRILPVLGIALTVVQVLILLGFTWLLEQLFLGAKFDQLTSSLLVGIMVYMMAVLWVQLSDRIRVSWLPSLFPIIMLSGFFLSMATNSTRRWWQFNLSFLGTSQARDSWRFNVTLILSAFVLMALIDYLFVVLTHVLGHQKKLIVLRLLLSLAALSLGAIGYFPNNQGSHHMHIRVANALVYLMIVLILGVKWLVPKASRDFLVTSYSIAGVLIVLAIGFQGVHYLSLTAFELAGSLLAMTWMLLLVNHLESLALPKQKEVILAIKP